MMIEPTLRSIILLPKRLLVLSLPVAVKPLVNNTLSAMNVPPVICTNWEAFLARRTPVVPGPSRIMFWIFKVPLETWNVVK